MRELERLFKGLADHTRLRVINLLLRGELCVCDIQYVLDSPQPNVSRHLAYLKHSGLVLDRREGQRMYYRLAEQGEAARRRLLAFLQAAFAGSEEFERDSRKLEKAIERGACTVAVAGRAPYGKNGGAASAPKHQPSGKAK
jgi:ArsR family transcriptional regulator